MWLWRVLLENSSTDSVLLKVVHEPKVNVNTGDVELVLELKDTDETRKVWDKKFTLTYKITLKEKTLDLKVNVKNDGEDEFDMTFCFHTYFTTSDLPSVGITDLKGMQNKKILSKQFPAKNENKKIETANFFHSEIANFFYVK